MLLYAVFFFVYAEKKDGKYLTCIGDGSEGKKMKITDHDLKTEIESFFSSSSFSRTQQDSNVVGCASTSSRSPTDGTEKKRNASDNNEN